VICVFNYLVVSLIVVSIIAGNVSTRLEVLVSTPAVTAESALLLFVPLWHEAREITVIANKTAFKEFFISAGVVCMLMQ
jgi:hypothetical protein